MNNIIQWNRAAPPTVEEVPDTQMCLATKRRGFVATPYGKTIRDEWGKHYRAWSEMPEPHEPSERPTRGEVWVAGKTRYLEVLPGDPHDLDAFFEATRGFAAG